MPPAATRGACIATPHSVEHHSVGISPVHEVFRKGVHVAGEYDTCYEGGDEAEKDIEYPHCSPFYVLTFYLALLVHNM